MGIPRKRKPVDKEKLRALSREHFKKMIYGTGKPDSNVHVKMGGRRP